MEYGFYENTNVTQKKEELKEFFGKRCFAETCVLGAYFRGEDPWRGVLIHFSSGSLKPPQLASPDGGKCRPNLTFHNIEASLMLPGCPDVVRISERRRNFRDLASGPALSILLVGSP